MARELRALPGVQMSVEVALEKIDLSAHALQLRFRNLRRGQPAEVFDFLLELLDLAFASFAVHAREPGFDPSGWKASTQDLDSVGPTHFANCLDERTVGAHALLGLKRGD